MMKLIKSVFIFSLISAIILTSFICANAEEPSSFQKTSDSFINQLVELVDLHNENSTTTNSYENLGETNRILVKTSTNNILDSTFNASHVVEGFNGWHILQYRNSIDMQTAINNYNEDASVEFVEIDCLFKIDDSVGISSSSEPIFDIEPSCTDWGVVTVRSDILNRSIINSTYLPQVTVAVLDTGIYKNHSFFVKTELSTAVLI